MNTLLREKSRLAGSGFKTRSTSGKYRSARRLEASLQFRLNRTAAISELLPKVLITTLAQLELARNAR